MKWIEPESDFHKGWILDELVANSLIYGTGIGRITKDGGLVVINSVS